MKVALAISALALTACDDPNVHNAVQTALYSYLPDGSDPAAQDRAASVLTHGIVESELECTGVAFGAPGKFVSVVYRAQRLQDGGCFARVDLFGAAPPAPGLVQSSASQLTRRSDADAAACPVESWHSPMVLSTTRLEPTGVVSVTSVFCGASPCVLPLTNCSGS